MRQEEQRVGNEHPEAVRSEPVPVPPPGDRAGRADVPEDALDDRGNFDDPAVSGDEPSHGRGTGRTRTNGRDADGDRAEFHEPGPVPTAFGATSVGGAVAASALASPLPEDEPDPRTESTARPGDGAADGPREGRRADPTAEFHRSVGLGDARPDERQARRGDAEALPTDAVDGRPERRADLTEDAEAGAAGYGSATPAMVDPDAEHTPAGRAGAGKLEAAGLDRPAGATVAAEPASLFDPAMAQGFRDRWRDVQLRFVDDPRAAAGEAQSLVDEAIQALSSALSAQKNKLGGWQDAGSSDTEQLRMAVRHYRDFLDRVLGR
ncbi:hypothetical protein GA0070610_0724 [Micromonospora echinofusca]|uniref:Uncharacterized protein n=1 Tax=Micromonospora echinofusca TaxID=47858 RepID=A0A1C5G3R4_MICEH|nr:hypothetical protein [Micromonospora echinofusca]SCG14519.1 hypothetical protein GA0070610_0724 [Micromonospora echinofusca]